MSKENATFIEVPPGDAPVNVEKPKRKRKKFPLQGYLKFQGLMVDVENREGSYRRGTAPDGRKWATYMHYPYGEIRGTEGADGDKLDCYVGPNAVSPLVVVVHQQDPDTSKYDEDKVMLGFNSPEEAVGAYKKQYDRPGFYQSHTVMNIGQFNQWVENRKNKGKKVAVKAATFFSDIVKAAGRYGKEQSMGFFSDIIKGETRGGKYLRRVPKPGGGFTYVYDDPKGKNPALPMDLKGKNELPLGKKETAAGYMTKDDLVAAGEAVKKKTESNLVHDPSKGTFEDYAKMIWEGGGHPGLSKKGVEKELADHKQMREDLASGKIKPKDVVGTGYKKPRDVAEKWLDNEISEHEKILASEGREHPIIRSNFKYHSGPKLGDIAAKKAKETKGETGGNPHLKSLGNPDTWTQEKTNALKLKLKTEESGIRVPAAGKERDAALAKQKELGDAIRQLSNWQLANTKKALAPGFSDIVKAFKP